MRPPGAFARPLLGHSHRKMRKKLVFCAPLPAVYFCNESIKTGLSESENEFSQMTQSLNLKRVLCIGFLHVLFFIIIILLRVFNFEPEQG